MAADSTMEEPAAMTPESRKRSAEPDQEEQPLAKRQRIESTNTIFTVGAIGTSQYVSTVPTTDALAKTGLQRAIALALKKVGFDSATPEAMESYVLMAENYLEHLIQDVKVFTNSGRRTHPVPRDFEQSLKRHNLSTTTLEPHKRNPISKTKRIPDYELLPVPEDHGADLPVLSAELDGAADKTAKPYIPSSFPDFPSIHTYRYTPQLIEPAIITDGWELLNSASSAPTVDGVQPQPKPQRPLAPEEIPHGDPKKIREAAAKESKSGENALRGLMRASKIAKQKEVWAAAQGEPARRERYNLWESAMRELLEDDTKAKGNELAPAAMHGEKGRFEIADHSMIVNTEKTYYRHEVPRAGARKMVTNTQTVPSKV